MPLGGKASCGDCSNITQTKDADFQDALRFSKLSFATDKLLRAFPSTKVAFSPRFIEKRSPAGDRDGGDLFRQIGLS
jgi:hypothetical protein